MIILVYGVDYMKKINEKIEKQVIEKYSRRLELFCLQDNENLEEFFREWYLNLIIKNTPLLRELVGKRGKKGFNPDDYVAIEATMRKAWDKYWQDNKAKQNNI